MRIAFDVKGTIDGPKQKFVLGLLKMLQEQGHDITVWSNSFSYAVDAVKQHGLNAKVQSKKSRSDMDCEEQDYFDICVEDDTSQSYLAAKRFIWVHELPSAMGGIKKLAEEIGNA